MALDRRDFLKTTAAAGLIGWPNIVRTTSANINDVAGIKPGIIGLGHEACSCWSIFKSTAR